MRRASSSPGPSVRVSDARGRRVSAPGLATWLAGVAPGAASRREVSIALVSDAFMRKLNRRFRNVDAATDVLSFRADEDPGDPDPAAPAQGQPPERPSRWLSGDALLGDIVIATGVARRQARRAKHSYGTELRVLALHGLLHLLGHDHEHDHGEMARLERRLRRRGGLREGLVERVANA